MKELKYINKYFLRYKYRLLLGLIITVLARIFIVYTPRLTGNAITIIESFLNSDIKDVGEFKKELVQYIVIIIGVALVGALLTFVMRQLLIVMSRLIEFDLKNDVFEHYGTLSQRFYKQNRTGDLMNRISEDVGHVRMYFGPALMYSINTITLFSIVIPMMIQAAPTLAAYTLIPLPFLSIAIYKLSRGIHVKSTIVQEYLSKLTVFTQETFSGISVVKAYGLEPQLSEEFYQLASKSKSKNMDLVKLQAWFFPFMILLIGLSNTLVIYIGGMQYVNGQIKSIGVLLEFILYVNMLTWPVATVGWVTSMIQQAEASQKRINAFLNVAPEIVSTTDEIFNFEPSISFDRVSFTYPDTNIQALKEVSFSLDKGKTIAILGKTGSGKSTLLNLIARLYDVDAGNITIGDINIREHNLKQLRNTLGFVPQDSFLFSDTIRNNIRFGIKEASDEVVMAAAKTAAVHDNIMNFSKGYDTILGERGVTLSGGQKQRVSIARALIKQPEIVLFDDCLSAVDTETEERILTNLKEETQGKTVVIVTHRVSTAKHADQILILDNGKVVQHGAHVELTTTSGYYKSLCEEQLSENI